MPNFEKIYNAAKQLNVRVLTEMMAQGISIDERASSITPAAKLAAEGNFAAANLLLTLGANVDFVSAAAVRAGNMKYAKGLIAKYGALPYEIAIGAASIGNEEELKELTKEHKIDDDWIAYGLASGGQTAKAEEFCKTHNPSIDYMCKGAAIGGYAEYMWKLIALREQQEAIDKDFIVSLIESAVLGGNIAIAQKLIAKYPAINVNQAFSAALAVCGYYEELKEFQQNKAETVEEAADILRNAARSGNLQYVEEVLQRLPAADLINAIVSGLIEGGNIGYAETLIIKHKISIEKVFDAVEGALTSGTKTTILALFSFIKDDSLFQNLITIVKKSSIKLEGIDLNAVIKKAAKVRQLMQKMGFNYIEALAWLDQDFRNAAWLASRPKIYGPKPQGKGLSANVSNLISSFLAPVKTINAEHLRARSFDFFKPKAQPQLLLSSAPAASAPLPAAAAVGEEYKAAPARI